MEINLGYVALTILAAVISIRRVSNSKITQIEGSVLVCLASCGLGMVAYKNNFDLALNFTFLLPIMVLILSVFFVVSSYRKSISDVASKVLAILLIINCLSLVLSI